MGARHARFTPFYRSESGENPGITPRWYGADRRTQQGRPPVLKDSRSAIAAHRPGRIRPCFAREKCMIFGCGGAPKRSRGSRRERLAVIPAPYCRRSPPSARQTADDGRDREAGRVAAKTPIHRCKRSDEPCIAAGPARRLRGRRHPAIYCSPTDRERGGGDSRVVAPAALGRASGRGHGRELIDLVGDDQRRRIAPPSPRLTICRRRWR